MSYTTAAQLCRCFIPNTQHTRLRCRCYTMLYAAQANSVLYPCVQCSRRTFASWQNQVSGCDRSFSPFCRCTCSLLLTTARRSLLSPSLYSLSLSLSLFLSLGSWQIWSAATEKEAGELYVKALHGTAVEQLAERLERGRQREGSYRPCSSHHDTRP